MCIKSFSEGHIDAIIKRKNGSWRFTGFYGNPEVDKRFHSWNLLEKLYENEDTPWIVGGDFNEIISNEEKSGGARRNDIQMESFRNVINSCKLLDVGYRGGKYTCRRGKSKDKRILERLDRMLVNQAMEMSSSDLIVKHLSFLSSDHRSLLVSWNFKDEAVSNRRFGKLKRFEEGWLKIREAEEIVKNSWINHPNPEAQNLCDNMLVCLDKLHH